MALKIICLGDIVGKNGCEAVFNTLPDLRRQYGADLVIANGENSAEGNGILPGSAERLFSCGVDIITGGNHTFRRREIYDMLESNEYLLRPANFPKQAIGHGSCIYDMGRWRVGVINLIGCVYMDAVDSPFDTADRIIEQMRADGVRIILVDIHAEATGEKGALGYHLDGRVSAVFGTHTHVQTNDDCILPQGTGYISDLGMCGPKNSVLGVKPEIVVEKMRTKMPIRFENGEGESVINGCVFEIDDKSSKTLQIEKIRL